MINHREIVKSMGQTTICGMMVPFIVLLYFQSTGVSRPATCDGSSVRSYLSEELQLGKGKAVVDCKVLPGLRDAKVTERAAVRLT